MCAAVQIKVPATIFFATLKDEYRKPEVGMWERFVKDFNGGVQPGDFLVSLEWSQDVKY